MPTGFLPTDLDPFAIGSMLSGMLGISVWLSVTLRRSSQLAAANAELTKLAGSDGLTGLANRRKFDQSIAAECRRASRHDRPISLLLLDVDRFKSFNDRYGHQAGDACLKQIATSIRAAVTRPGDMAARYGGEEFALMLPETDERGAALTAERARRAVEDLGIPHDGNPECGGIVTVSIGCSTSRPPKASSGAAATLVAEADRLLYEAKRLGRNRIAPDAEVPAVLSPSEEDRLRLVSAYRTAGIGERSGNLDSIARMAAVLLGTPGAFVALLDRDDVVVIGRHGLDEDIADITHAVCVHALGTHSPIVIPDTTNDPRFRGSVPANRLRFLAAAPLLAPEGGQHLGALWIADRFPHATLDDTKRALLARLASLIVEDLVQRRRQHLDELQIRAA